MSTRLAALLAFVLAFAVLGGCDASEEPPTPGSCQALAQELPEIEECQAGLGLLNPNLGPYIRGSAICAAENFGLEAPHPCQEEVKQCGYEGCDACFDRDPCGQAAVLKCAGCSLDDQLSCDFEKVSECQLHCDAECLEICDSEQQACTELAEECSNEGFNDGLAYQVAYAALCELHGETAADYCSVSKAIGCEG